jgi:hypothetical protein
MTVPNARLTQLEDLLRQWHEPLCRRWHPGLRNPAGNAPSRMIAEPLCHRWHPALRNNGREGPPRPRPTTGPRQRGQSLPGRDGQLPAHRQLDGRRTGSLTQSRDQQTVRDVIEHQASNRPIAGGEDKPREVRPPVPGWRPPPPAAEDRLAGSDGGKEQPRRRRRWHDRGALGGGENG